MKIKIAICDDSNEDQDYVRELLNVWAKESSHKLEIHTFLSAEQFLFQYEEEKDFQILILDIEMGQMNGVELAKKLRVCNQDVQIMFATGFPDYMAEGYEVNALHYLMKPIRQEKLFQVMEKTLTNLNKTERFLILQDNGEMLKLSLQQIFYVEVFSHSCTIHTKDGNIESKISISKLETELGEKFIRVHRSYLVNIEFIKRIMKTEILLENGDIVPLSRRKYAEVNVAFMKYFRR